MKELIDHKLTTNLDCFQYEYAKKVDEDFYHVNVQYYLVHRPNGKSKRFAISGRLIISRGNIIQMDCGFQDKEEFGIIVSNYNDADPEELWNDMIESVISEYVGI